MVFGYLGADNYGVNGYGIKVKIGHEELDDLSDTEAGLKHYQGDCFIADALQRFLWGVVEGGEGGKQGFTIGNRQSWYGVLHAIFPVKVWSARPKILDQSFWVSPLSRCSSENPAM